MGPHDRTRQSAATLLFALGKSSRLGTVGTSLPTPHDTLAPETRTRISFGFCFHDFLDWLVICNQDYLVCQVEPDQSLARHPPYSN